MKRILRVIQQTKSSLKGEGINHGHISDFLLILAALAFPLTTYPRTYGTDAFQIMWMTNAIRDGALFSQNSWLIHFTSYFGMYPFSHRAIGIPLVLAILTTSLEIASEGMLGLTEAVLLFDILLIIAIHRYSRDLAKMLFEEFWSRFVFTAAVLFSPNVLWDCTMTVSTRLGITLIMIILLRLGIQMVSNPVRPKDSTVFKIILLLLVGALIHRLWLGTLLAVGFVVFVRVVREITIIRKTTLILLLPLAAIGFLMGLSVFHLHPQKIWSPFFENSTLLGILVNLTIHEMLQIGVILVFFPIGVMAMLHKELELLSDATENGENRQARLRTEALRNKNLYLLLFIPPFFLVVPTFYSTTIFLPIQITFSVHGLVYCKNHFSNVAPKVPRMVFALAVLLFSTVYSILYPVLILEINLWYLPVLLCVVIGTYLVQLIVDRIRKRTDWTLFRRLESVCCRSTRSGGLILIMAILVFSTTTVTGRLRSVDGSPYPWENRYLTEEEQEIISYLQSEEVSGLVFTNVPAIANRISGVGFLPVLTDKVSIGTALYYGLITPVEVRSSTIFTLSGSLRLRFYAFEGEDPILSWRDSVICLNVSLEEDLDALRDTYQVQYIITGNETALDIGGRLSLTQSLPNVFTPTFRTNNLLVWKIY